MIKINPENKRIGGPERAEVARKELKDIFSNENHPLYFSKDIDLAHRYNVIRHTIYSIRDELGVLSRLDRIIKVLLKIKTEKYTIRELSKKLNIKYQSIYKVLIENKISYKPDIPPIHKLKKHNKSKLTSHRR